MTEMKKTRTSVNLIISNIEASINNGTFRPGEKLPTQSEMQELYGASRMVIREAIRLLEGKGLIYTRQGSGMFITDDFSRTNTAFNDVAGEYRMSEIFKVFSAFFIGALDEAVLKKDLSEIEKMGQLNSDLIDNYPVLTKARKIAYEMSFCSGFIHFSGNRLALNMYLAYARTLNEVDFAVTSDRKKYIDILKTDASIIDAVVRRDAYRARFWADERQRIMKDIIRRDGLWDKEYIVRM